MAQIKKTPKHLVDAIAYFEAYRDEMEERMRVKVSVCEENQAAHVRRATLAEMQGMVYGAAAMLEEVLIRYGCYAGYTFVGSKQCRPDGTVFREKHLSTTAEDYAAWRREYFVRY